MDNGISSYKDRGRMCEEQEENGLCRDLRTAWHFARFQPDCAGLVVKTSIMMLRGSGTHFNGVFGREQAKCTRMHPRTVIGPFF